MTLYFIEHRHVIIFLKELAKTRSMDVDVLSEKD
jgi:hypothetical protein